jgi:hypothetical protein
MPASNSPQANLDGGAKLIAPLDPLLNHIH